ncbi:DNA topoisomerase VI, B subunit [Caldisphaera lagunensis DSM 15908]|uniref:Type 2 DNA topoisomerase 6 subunit B n=1 Tax=Caldisphaera lagunensis (strain DSM 15908 / JCM 11604 / ANMR 0165 / IC-154) TaxID=1056495 RepID=L0ADJ2_CALLD|nr:DNA topoisomerase VI subunit B [Caldisphaera lagunensis]AFZ71100.1 DNA topoisomerase VI, B subunit [Caldisphaera lagunensis DSM 15908]
MSAEAEEKIKAQEKYREMSIAEFFAKNKELAGFSNTTRALYQTIRELVENSLDATDTHSILPEIRISLRELEAATDDKPAKYEVSVEDNGIGVPPNEIANAFGKVLYSSKYVIRQTRGMYGLGIKAAILYSQMTTGQPVFIISSMDSSENIYYRKLLIDIKKNEPVIIEEGQLIKKNNWHGTKVYLTLEGDWTRAKPKIIEYIKRIALISPYAEIIFETPDNEIFYFPRVTKKIPKPPSEAKPHPHGIDIEQLKAMISFTKTKTLLEFMTEEFQTIGEITARKFLESMGLDPNMNPKSLIEKGNSKLLQTLSTGLRTYKGFRPPRSEYLSPIGEELIEVGLKRLFNPEWVKAITRQAKAYEGHPFIVEAGIAYGGNIPPSEEPVLLRYANKIPLLYEEREDVSYKVVSSINWKIYNIEEPMPLVVLVHVASTKIPYKGVGKESLSEVSELESEIRNAIQEIARSLRLYISKRNSEHILREKIVTISKYIPEIARSLSVLSIPPEKWGNNKNNDKDLVERLIKIVSRSIEFPKIDGKEEDPEKVVRSVIANVKLEQ